MNKDAVILIPSYNPDEAIMQDFLGELSKRFKNIVIVNDGSDKIHDSFFEKLSNNYIVISHYKNLGKVPVHKKTGEFYEHVLTDLSIHGEKYILNKKYMKKTYTQICGKK